MSDVLAELIRRGLARESSPPSVSRRGMPVVSVGRPVTQRMSLRWTRLSEHVLADGNVLVALAVEDHVHHGVALDWFEGSSDELATCPLTEGTLLRFLIRAGHSAQAAIGVLDTMRAQPWHHFWPDSIAFVEAHLAGVIGHRQVTDATWSRSPPITPAEWSPWTRGSPPSTEIERSCSVR